MKFLDELAAWAPGEHSFTALAEAANLRVSPSATAGISTNRTEHWVRAAKNDADIAVKCVALSKDPKFLTKMAKDRRVAVRIAVARNPKTPISVFSEMLRREKSHECKYRVEEALKARIARMPAEKAIELLADGMLPVIADQVAHHPKLAHEHVEALVAMEFQVNSMWGSTRVQRMVDIVATRRDLHQLPVGVLWQIAEKGLWSEVAEVLFKRRSEGEVQEFLERLYACEVAPRSIGHALSWVAKTKGLSREAYTTMFELASSSSFDAPLKELAGNGDCPWDLFMQSPVKRVSVQALARGIAATFGDEAGVWMLAASLADETHTVADVLGVLRATHPEAVKTHS